MSKLEELRNRNPRAWTQLLTQEIGTDAVIVEAVGEEPLIESGYVSRFLLSLAGYNEPIGLIGKRTNAVEALFYEFFAPNFPHFTPACYFQHIGLDDGWLVLADVQNDHQPETWNANDFEILIGNLASLHAAYWGKCDTLDEYGLPTLLDEYRSRTASASGRSGVDLSVEQPLGQMERIERWLQSQRRYLTEHALRAAGPSLAPLMTEASKGLDILREFDGWPGIVDDRHFTALADLLDDPLPALYPLRQLPCTLLHGDPSPEHWSLTLFDEHYLVDWHRTTMGPGVYDLVRFIDQIALLPDTSSAENMPVQARLAEETMVDNYILAMRGELGTQFDARSTRIAVPAARCLLVLTHWLPKLAGWLQKMSYDKDSWRAMNELSDEALLDAGLGELGAWRQSLAVIFDRFLRAYRLL